MFEDLGDMVARQHYDLLLIWVIIIFLFLGVRS